MRWIRKLVKYLLKVSLRSQIPPLPRMPAAEYRQINPEIARVMARYGIRSPSGLKTAFRRHQVATIDALVARLEHHRVRREIRRRWRAGMQRIAGGSHQNPHAKEIERVRLDNPHHQELQERIRRLKRD